MSPVPVRTRQVPITGGPQGTAYLDAGSLFHEHVKHTHHDHPSLNLVNFLHAFSSSSSLVSSMRWDLIYKFFD